MSFFSKIKRMFKKAFGTERFLCDTCKYDYGDVCRNPDRPNATECKDYKPK